MPGADESLPRSGQNLIRAFDALVAISNTPNRIVGHVDVVQLQPMALYGVAGLLPGAGKTDGEYGFDAGVESARDFIHPRSPHGLMILLVKAQIGDREIAGAGAVGEAHPQLSKSIDRE